MLNLKCVKIDTNSYRFPISTFTAVNKKNARRVVLTVRHYGILGPAFDLKLQSKCKIGYTGKHIIHSDNIKEVLNYIDKWLNKKGEFKNEK